MKLACRSLHGSVDWNLSVRHKGFGGHVAPSTGAWIETANTVKESEIGCSSLPPRERGLKLKTKLTMYVASSRSLHGSVDWNQFGESRGTEKMSRSLHGSVDWNLLMAVCCWFGRRRSLHGSVDWNQSQQDRQESVGRRSLHGSVDWNPLRLLRWFIWPGRSLHGSVDWNKSSLVYQSIGVCVAPSTGAWIETEWELKAKVQTLSLPPRERGLKPLTLR